MAKRPTLGECAWTRRICKEMQSCGALVLPYVASKMQPAGYPDRIVVWRGEVYWLEFKGQDTAVQPLQLQRHKELRARGANAFVVRHQTYRQDSWPVSLQWLITDSNGHWQDMRFAYCADRGQSLLYTLTSIVCESHRAQCAVEPPMEGGEGVGR